VCCWSFLCTSQAISLSRTGKRFTECGLAERHLAMHACAILGHPLSPALLSLTLSLFALGEADRTQRGVWWYGGRRRALGAGLCQQITAGRFQLPGFSFDDRVRGKCRWFLPVVNPPVAAIFGALIIALRPLWNYPHDLVVMAKQIHHWVKDKACMLQTHRRVIVGGRRTCDRR